MFSGTADGSFRFDVDINYSNNGSLLRMVSLSVLNYIDDQTIVREVSIPEGGMYDIVVRSRNTFGTSQEDIIFEGLSIVPG